MPIDNNRNSRARDSLVEVLRTDRALAMTGAGLSVWAGYKTWPQLIDCLAVAVKNERDVDVDLLMRNHQDPLHRAQPLGDQLGPSGFGRFIRDEFGPLPLHPHEVLYRFISLPFRHLLTFNFDESAELVHAHTRIPCGSVSSSDGSDLAAFVRRMDLPKSEYPRQVVHLHGKFSDALERVALTSRGYKSLYNDAFFRNLLWLLFTNRSLVFVGYSFEDEDFIHSFRSHMRDLEGYPGPCHFAIIGLRPDEEDEPRRMGLRDEYSLEAVFYPVHVNGNEEDHRGFVDLISNIADIIGEPIEIVARPRALPVGDTPPPDAGDLQVADRLAQRIIDEVDPRGDDVPD